MRLRTIGGLWIEGAPAAPSLGPRQLGLLALVAAAGKKGVSRERVIGILWAETGEEQARHTLSQTLYSMRREAGRDLITATSQLRLDPAVSSDIGDLHQAVEAGDLETAGGLYTGKFLDGFYLPGAPEFERWVEEERAGLEAIALRAIERLAKRAEEENQPVDSVRWWQRLTELDPLSARYTVGYMRALAAAGDRSGALTRAKFYSDLVHQELGAPPDPAVCQLEQSIRTAPVAPAPPPPAPPPTAVEPAVPSPQPVPAPPRRRRPKWLAPSVVLAAIAVALAVRGFGSRSGSAPPFLAVGEIRTEEPSDSSRLSAILRDMLATSLGGIEGLQVVANSRLVELMPRGADPMPGAMSDAARRAGATEIIEGEVTRDSATLTLSLRRVAVGRGVVRRGYRVRAANRYALVDSATAAIARDLHVAPPSMGTAQVRTASPDAYVLYEEGLRANYGYDSPAAYRLMTAALARDSNFAMAAYYAWQLSRSYADESTSAVARARAKRLAVHTIERERLLIQGSLAEVDAPLHQAVAIAETLTVKYPTDPEGQILLGTVRGRQGDWAGSVAAFGRAFALDSLAGVLANSYCRVCVILDGMAASYIWWDSAAAAERVTRRLIALRPADPLPWSNLTEALLRQGRRKEGEAADFRGAEPGSGGGSRVKLHRDQLRWGRYEEVDRELIEDVGSRNPAARADAWWLLILSLRDQGRLREADTLMHRGRLANTNAMVHEPSSSDLAMVALEMGRPEETIRSYRADAEGTARSTTPPGLRARALSWYLTLAGTAHAAAGDTAVVRRLADSLEILGSTSTFGRDAKLHYVLRGLLLQREGRHADAIDAFRRSLFSLTDGYTRTNLMMARSLLQLGRAAEAIAVLRPALRGGVDGSNTYVSRTELHEAMAQAFELAGPADSARAHYAMVERSWRRADPRFHDRYLQARQKAGAVTGAASAQGSATRTSIGTAPPGAATVGEIGTPGSSSRRSEEAP